ncbi:MAG: hypothetical protein M3024_15050, partial [Candidatus Dormibacteraeota bacterium]|nr:hypothetical protein [Candidatus Dormibacteraeota bacterium]
MGGRAPSGPPPAIRAAGWLLVAGIVAIVAVMVRRLSLRRPGWRAGEARPPGRPEDLRGLSMAEAEALLPAIDLDRIEKAARRGFIVRAVRSGLFTIFNLDMFAITALMFILGSPLSGLLTSAVLIANVVVRVGQQLLARSRLEKMIGAIRPRVTVIREGSPQQLAIREIVRGDLVAVGLGDEIPLAGVVVGASQIEVAGVAALALGGGEARQGGDSVEAGSYCVGGHAIVRSKEAGAEREALRSPRSDVLARAPTPLEILLRRVLFVLLGLVVIFSGLLLTGRYIPRGPASEEAYRNAFSLVFGVAPTSLFFLLVLSYVIGLLDVAGRGGLVYQPATIEALAAVDTICLTAPSVMGGAQVSLVPIEPAAEGAPPPDLARRLLGDVIHSVSPHTVANDLIAAAVTGSNRRPLEVAGHLSFFGWQAASFDQPDIRGTFVVGSADAIAPGVARRPPAVVAAVAARVEKSRTVTRRGVARAQGLVARIRPGASARVPPPSEPEPPSEVAETPAAIGS